MAKELEKESITGIDTASDRKAAEYDLLEALLEASEYKNDIDNIATVTITKGEKVLFTVRLHPLSEPDVRKARKAATSYVKNKKNNRFVKEEEFNTSTFNSWLIYLATVDEDRERVWDNKGFMKQHGLMQGWESIDKLIPFGKKRQMAELVLEISGMNDEDDEMVTDEQFRESDD